MKQERADTAIPIECRDALRAIEGGPIDLDAETLGHISACRQCSEARVMWLALEDCDNAQAPAGYFEALPGRVLRKLPAQATRHLSKIPLLTTAATLLILAGTTGGYWFGRHDQTGPVLLEAVHTPRDFQDIFADPTSFSSFELFSQIPDLTPEETKAMMTDLTKPEASVQPAKPEDD